MAPTRNQHGLSQADAGYERTEVGLRVIALSAAGIALLAFVSLFIVQQIRGVMRSRLAAERKSAIEPVAPTFGHAPRSPAPPGELENVRAEEDRLLRSYGWISAADGVIHVPIERAMEIVLAEGLPAASSQPAARDR